MATKKNDSYLEITSNKRYYAVKVVKREKMGQAFTWLELRELDILRKLDHPNIIKLYEIYADEDYFYFVLEYCSGGELLQYLISKNAHLGEFETIKIMSEIFKAIGYLHENKICHRDLKLENFLFDHAGVDAHIKLIDFGLAKQNFDLKAGLKSIVGSPNFIAPEILNKQEYDYKCDIWSLGVIIFILLSGDPPFQGENNFETFNRIKKGHFSFDGKEWKKITNEGKDLIKKLLVLEPNKRITITEALKHAWFNLIPNEIEKKTGIERKKSIVFDNKLFKILKNFKTPGKFKKEVMKVILEYFKNDEDHQRMTEIFKKLDTLNKGHITLSEIEEALSKATNAVAETKECLNDLIKFMRSNNQTLELTYTDFLMATLDKNKYMDMKKLIAAFKHFDLDNSGFITIESLRKVMQRAGQDFTENDIKEMIKEGDSEKLGMISFIEFFTLIKNDSNIPLEREKIIPKKIVQIEEKNQDLNESFDSCMSSDDVFAQMRKVSNIKKIDEKKKSGFSIQN